MGQRATRAVSEGIRPAAASRNAAPPLIPTSIMPERDSAQGEFRDALKQISGAIHSRSVKMDRPIPPSGLASHNRRSDTGHARRLTHQQLDSLLQTVYATKQGAVVDWQSLEAQFNVPVSTLQEITSVLSTYETITDAKGRKFSAVRFDEQARAALSAESTFSA
eukprot:ANDGO_03512.mRNA.1 hypothetical protein